MSKKRRLGRGLDALLSGTSSDVMAVTEQEIDHLRNIPIDLLQRGQYQPRMDMRQDTLEELANSIKAQGVVQPIIVRPLSRVENTPQSYEIVAGERRWRAAQMAGLADIPAVIREVENSTAIAMALIENIQREDLNPLEEAGALNRLIDEFELTHEEAAAAVGRSRAAVSNLLRLLELSDKVKAMLESRQLDMGHARALLALTNKSQQFKAAQAVIKKGLSVRETEKLVRRYLGDSGKKAVSSAKTENVDIRRLEKDISDKLGAKIIIDHTASGSGKLIIHYGNLDELDGILRHIR